jgi:transcriptional regulator with XRE-family HTH domain
MEQYLAIRQAREAARMSQAHLAAAAGVSKRTIIRAEQGLRIQDENLRCLCSVLGLDARDIALPMADPEPLTPMAILRDHVEKRREGILWEGAPDAARWRIEVRYGALLACHLGLAAAALAAAWLYVETLRDRVDGHMIDAGSPTILAAAGALLSLYMVARALRAFKGVFNRNDSLGRTIHILSNRAFYTARVGWSDDNEVAGIERLDLGEDRDNLWVRPRSWIWPSLRSIRIRDESQGLMGRTVHVEGVPDLQRLARFMRGDSVVA